MSEDYYTTLGVPPTADGATIKARFRHIAKENHPDLGGARDWSRPEKALREKRMKQAAMAYSVLSNPGFRAQYDAERSMESRRH